MAESLVSLQRVCKEYRANWPGNVKTALADINLDIAHGESVGFIGHNGAGKSTTYPHHAWAATTNHGSGAFERIGRD